MTRFKRIALLAAAISALLVCRAAAQAPAPKPIENPTAGDLASGARVFGMYCARCHGFDGSGGAGPPLARPTLRHASDDAGIIDILWEGIPGTAMQAAWSLSEREVTEVAAYVRSLGRRPPELLPGDVVQGRRVFDRAGCAACHVVNGAGVAVGPELSAIGVLRGSAYLRQSLVDPAASRPERAVGYEPYAYPAYEIVVAQPRGGTAVEGVRLNEDAFTIQIRDRAGRLQSLHKVDLVSLRADPAASVMPSYRDTLSAAELNDVVAYLMTLRAER